MKIRISPTALQDLKEIKAYIETDLSSPEAAKNVVSRIINDYSLLEKSPYIGASLSAKVSFDTDFRYLVSGNYLIFYKVGNEHILIYRILYGRRDYLKIIFDADFT